MSERRSSSALIRVHCNASRDVKEPDSAMLETKGERLCTMLLGCGGCCSFVVKLKMGVKSSGRNFRGNSDIEKSLEKPTAFREYSAIEKQPEDVECREQNSKFWLA